MRLQRVIAAAAATVVAATVFGALPASATNIGYEGCTPGYWKNHTDNWLENPSTVSALPTDSVKSLYSQARANVADKSLLEGLQGGGGPGADGAAVILTRAAVSAWLNAAHEGLGYPWRRMGTGLDGRPALVATVNAAFDSGSRSTMLALATRLDTDNNLGCPLN